MMRVPPEYRDRLVGPQIPWKKIEGELLRVIRLIRLCEMDMHSKSASKTWAWAMLDLHGHTQDGSDTAIAHYLDLRRSLYALLEVECPPRLSAPVYMPVRHRFDFFKACILLDPIEDGKRHFLAPDEEVLVGGPLVVEGLAKKVLRPLMPRLQFFITPKGYLEWQYGPHDRGEPPPGGYDWRPDWERKAPSS
jgi:hypothetical protein